MLIQYVVMIVAGAWPPAAGEIASRKRGGGGGGGGWLGRLVQYHKAAFLNDFQMIDDSKVDIVASVETAPVGYSDAPGWDEQAVLRLLSLVSQSRAPSIKPVKRALRRALRPTRRYIPYIPPGLNSHDLFPSLAGNIENFIYNDYKSEESTSEEIVSNQLVGKKKQTTTGATLNVTERDKLMVLVVRNPVEARLPSARISVGLLRKIMEERALAGRVHTPPTKLTRTWLPRFYTTPSLKKVNVTTTTPTSEANDGNTTKKADKNEETKRNATEEAGDAAGGDDTANNGTSDIGTVNNGTPDNGNADNGTANNSTPENGTANNGMPDNGTANDGTPNNGNADNDTADNGTADNGGGGDGGTGGAGGGEDA